MRFNIIKTFILTYRKLFVLVVDLEFDDLHEARFIFNNELYLNMQIHSVEMVNLSNKMSAVGITIAYDTQENLVLLETLKEGDFVSVM